MRRITSAAICLWLVTGFPLSIAAGDQPSDGDWQRVRQLQPRTEIKVTLKGGKRTTHRFVRADEATLVVTTYRFLRRAAVETLGRADVLEIDGPPLGHPRLKGAAIGTAIAGTAGLVAVAANCSRSTSSAECRAWGELATLNLAVAGTLIGAGVGSLLAKPEVIYTTPDQSRRSSE